MKKESKLVTITRNDISPGYQKTQAIHSVADFAYEYPSTFRKWKEDTNSVVTLQIENEFELDKLYHKLKDKGIEVTKFYEPDIDSHTSICFWATPETRKITSKLKLSLIEYGEDRLKTQA